MIAKLSTGNGFGGATSYLLRNGESDEERAKVKVLAAVGVDYSVNENGNIVLDSRQVARDFRFQSMMMPSVRKPVYDIALSWKVGEHVPSDEKLARTEEFMRMIGFDNTQYIIVEHEKENEHSHAIANIVDNDGNRISTKDLIDRMHAAAREITKKYGYQWGDTAKKETIEKTHKPHEKARYTIEPKVKAAVAKAKDIQDLPGLLNSSGINCRIKYSDAGKPVGISFSVELDGQLHTFKGSDLDRSLSAGNIAKVIDGRLIQQELARQQQEASRKAEVDKVRDMIAGYNSVIPPMCRGEVSLLTIKNNAYHLMKAAKDAGIAVSKETTAKFGELKDTWAEFKRLEQEARTTKDAASQTKALGGLIMLLNPIIGLTVKFLAKVTNDIRQSKIKAQKKQLLARVVSIRSEISQLQEQKAQLKIEKQERLQEYLEAKQMLKEYNEGLETVDQTVHNTHIDILKEEFPFRDKGHVQYIIHGPHDASIFKAEEGPGKYRYVPTGRYYEQDKEKKYEIKADYYEEARRALKDKVMFVAGDRGPNDFYEALLEEQKYGNYRVGDMQIHPDGKISFGQERVFGDPKLTEHSVPKMEEPVVQKPTPTDEKKPVHAAAPTPQAPPTPKPNYEIVKKFTADFQQFRIKKEADGTYKLQQLEPDTSSPVIDHKYSKNAWFVKAKFTSFSEVEKDANGVYFKIKDYNTGKTRYISQYGNDLSNRQLQKLGIGTGNGYGGPKM